MLAKVLTYLGVFAAGALAVVGYLAWGGSGISIPSTPSETASVAPPSNESVAPAPAGGSGTTAIGDVARNTMVTVSGTVQRIADEDEFVLADETGSITVWTGSEFFTVDQDEAVVVTGFIDDDLIIEIYAQEIVRADGSVVTIGGSTGY